MEIDQDKEIWQNPTLGTKYVKMYDHENRLVNVAIRSGKRQAITPKERQINQDLAATPELDMFNNGGLVPVTLVESAADYDQIKGNPNHVGESDIKEMFKLDAPEMSDKLSGITNVATLKRIAEIAAETSTNATTNQIRAVSDRIAEVKPVVQERLSAEEIEAGKHFKPVFPS
jgi:hypothetical protein